MVKPKKTLTHAASKTTVSGKRVKVEHGESLRTAFEKIRELIVHGKLAPGTWMVEADIADRLNMSRTPIRAAIQWLRREGYVLEQRVVSKSRMLVAPLTKEDANELYLIIGKLEGMAGRSAAQAPPTEREKLAVQLESLNEKLQAIAKGKGNAGDIFEIDRDFHRAIVNAGSGPRLSALHHAVEPQAERYWRLYASSIITSLNTSIAEHVDIIKALRRGDYGAMELALQRNWSKGAERLGRVIEMFGERGSW